MRAKGSFGDNIVRARKIRFPVPLLDSRPSKAVGCVTTFTRPAEGTPMHVIFVMTCEAILRGSVSCRGAFGMTRVASNRAMCSGQFKVRIARMIEDPAVPSVGGMAVRTSAANTALMMGV